MESSLSGFGSGAVLCLLQEMAQMRMMAAIIKTGRFIFSSFVHKSTRLFARQKPSQVTFLVHIEYDDGHIALFA